VTVCAANFGLPEENYWSQMLTEKISWGLVSPGGLCRIPFRDGNAGFSMPSSITQMRKEITSEVLILALGDHDVLTTRCLKARIRYF
jgi:hypothetical protein